MFCKKCGSEMNDDAKFCLKCGAGINEEGNETRNTVIEDNNVRYLIRPTYIFPYKIITTGLRAFGIALLFIFWLFNGKIIYTFESFGLPIFLGIIAYVIIKLLLEKNQYEKLLYNFYATKVEYVDGFLNKEQKELKYKFIREITFTQNIFERMFNIGKIRIYTNASSGHQGNRHNNGMNNGIIIHCVTNPREEYSTIKRLIDESNEEMED